MKKTTHISKASTLLICAAAFSTAACGGDGGKTTGGNDAGIAMDGQVGDAPKIVRFDVSPLQWSGERRQLTIGWKVTGGGTVALTANNVAVPGFSGMAEGSMQAEVVATTTFVLRATNSSGSDSKTVTSARLDIATEQEPNDDKDSATAIPGPTGTLDAALGPAAGSTPDVDWYAIDVTEGAAIIAATSDGNGNCAPDTLMKLYAPDGTTVITENDDVDFRNGDVCSVIDGATDAAARQLAAGRYYLAVEGYVGASGPTEGPYALEVRIVAPRCGSGIRDAMEQCDDGNSMAGDGCSATCGFEFAATLTGPDFDRVLDGTLSSSTASWYASLTLTSTAYVLAETFVPTVGACNGTDRNTAVIFWTEDLEGIVGDANSGLEDACSLIDPNFYDEALLGPGRYIVQILAYTGVVPAFQVHLKASAPGCGNGVLEEADLCDDGNSASADGCSAACAIEPAMTINPPGRAVRLDFTSRSDVEGFAFNITAAGQSVTATITASDDTCEPYPSLVIYDAQWREVGASRPVEIQGQLICAAIVAGPSAFTTDMPVGTYYLAARNDLGHAPVSLDMYFAISSARCGNGILENSVSETCDDNNVTAGDGCSATCAFEQGITVETEPNDDAQHAFATGVGASNSSGRVAGVIDPASDADWYAIEIPPGQTKTVYAKTYGDRTNQDTCNGDTVLRLYDATGTLITENDDTSFEERLYCSQIDGTAETATEDAANLGAGQYFLEVIGYDGRRLVSAYYLDIELR